MDAGVVASDVEREALALMSGRVGKVAGLLSGSAVLGQVGVVVWGASHRLVCEEVASRSGVAAVRGWRAEAAHGRAFKAWGR